MITVLTINDKTASDKWGRLKNFFKGDSISTEIITLQHLTVIHIIYNNRKNHIKWQNIAQQAGYEKQCIFCSSNIELPKKYGFKRYCCKSHMQRMAENAALSVLETAQIAPENINIGLYDPDASKADLVYDLIKFTKSLTVVTSEPHVYSHVQKNILEDTGADFVIKKSLDSLKLCHVVIAPKRITRCIPLKDSAMVFTGELPTVTLLGNVICNYKFYLPGWCRRIKPPSLSDEYFAQALYDKGHQHTLGSLIPNTVILGGNTYTVAQAATKLKTQCEKT